MFALIFRFPAGRYHATPWGRNVNEGAVAWPPEPYRILRALIAVWHRKADKTRFDEAALHRLIEQLAQSAPLYRLPPAVHAHTRHYMPQAKPEDKKLVFDAFYRVALESELVVAWPELALDLDSYALAEHLAGLLGYLGRAESLVIARVSNSIGGDFPVQPGVPAQAGWTSVDVLAPLSPDDYSKARSVLLGHNNDRSRSKSRQAFEATVPEKLTDALQVETSAIQNAKWSQPPAARLVVYGRPAVGPRPPAVARAPRAITRPDPTVARLILAGRPCPPITEAVKIGEVFRRALMARCKGPVPQALSGRDQNNEPLRDPSHAHSFFLPEDHDEDGFIDHLVLFARQGLTEKVRRAVEALRSLWIEDRRGRDDEDDTDGGRREWRLALEGFGGPDTYAECALLRCSQDWVSVSPYLRPRHLKGGDPWEETRVMVRSECERRGWPPPEVHLFGNGARAGRDISVGGGLRNVLSFYRFRSRRGLVQPDRAGLALRLVFPKEVCGPVALGFGSHFGLGLFRAVEDQASP